MKYNKRTKKQRIVHLCKGVQKRKGVKLWAFGYDDLMSLFKVSQRTIKRYIECGLFDPTDLQSILTYWLSVGKGLH